jgi:lysophospholipase L1-like esterase
MIRILCYGDSNTHGTKPMYGPEDVARFGPEERWPAVVAASLGSGYSVIEEGLPGRTTVHDDAIEGIHKNGRTYLLPCLESHWPLDAVVIALGVNDLKPRHGVGPYDIAAGIGVLVDLVYAAPGFGRAPPKILVVAPAPIIETGWLGDLFAGGTEPSRRLGAAIERVAEARGVGFLDLATVATVSPVDGIHFDADGHRRIGAAVTKALLDLLQT